MSPLRAASFEVAGRSSYGAVNDAGIIDLGRRLSAKYPALIDVFRAGAPASVSSRRSGGDAVGRLCALRGIGA